MNDHLIDLAAQPMMLFNVSYSLAVLTFNALKMFVCNVVSTLLMVFCQIMLSNDKWSSQSALTSIWCPTSIYYHVLFALYYWDLVVPKSHKCDVLMLIDPNSILSSKQNLYK